MSKKRKFYLVLFILTCWFIIHAVIVTIDGLTDNPTKADCIVILGNKVNPDGTLSPRLKARVDKGLALYREGYASTIMVSGGLGTEGHYEGTVMGDYLVDHGVPASDIIVDDQGVNTQATAANFAQLAKEHNLHSAIVVSQFFHITRTKTMIRRYGISTYGVHAEYFELRDFYSLVREFFAYYQFIVPGV